MMSLIMKNFLFLICCFYIPFLLLGISISFAAEKGICKKVVQTAGLKTMEIDELFNLGKQQLEKANRISIRGEKDADVAGLTREIGQAIYKTENGRDLGTKLIRAATSITPKLKKVRSEGWEKTFQTHSTESTFYIKEDADGPVQGFHFVEGLLELRKYGKIVDRAYAISFLIFENARDARTGAYEDGEVYFDLRSRSLAKSRYAAKDRAMDLANAAGAETDKLLNDFAGAGFFSPRMGRDITKKEIMSAVSEGYQGTSKKLPSVLLGLAYRTTDVDRFKVTRVVVVTDITRKTVDDMLVAEFNRQSNGARITYEFDINQPRKPEELYPFFLDYVGSSVRSLSGGSVGSKNRNKGTRPRRHK